MRRPVKEPHMITASTPPRQLEPPRWQQEMAAAITSLEDLAQALGLDPTALDAADAPAQAGRGTSIADGPGSRGANAAAAFRLLVPASYVRRMRHGDPRDPLLLQVLPSRHENDDSAGYGSDPLGEREAMRAPGLLKKYEGRALLITTSACAIHCRYCFRREFPYTEHQSESKRWSAALEEIARDSSIEEVILSGGDPLSLSDARLATLTDAIAKIRHVRRIRVHTRQPVVLPSRVDSGLIAWLKGIGVPTVIVLHSNHPNEIDDEVREACVRLRQTGVTLLNQAVLLRDVNDNADILAELSQKLFDAGVLPYYLHVLDRVRGAAHFDISEDSARALAGQLAARLPGYLVPRLVREVHGAPAKVGLTPHF